MMLTVTRQACEHNWHPDDPELPPRECHCWKADDHIHGHHFGLPCVLDIPFERADSDDDWSEYGE